MAYNFKKGQKRLPNAGRKKGSPNKVTKCMREAWMYAFDDIGGAEKLADWAREHPSEFYKLASKLIPQRIEGDKENPLTLVIQNAADSTKTKLDSILKQK